jgi:hypothetical protein
VKYLNRHETAVYIAAFFMAVCIGGVTGCIEKNQTPINQWCLQDEDIER